MIVKFKVEQKSEQKSFQYQLTADMSLDLMTIIRFPESLLFDAWLVKLI